MIFKILLIGLVSTLCKGGVLQNYEPVRTIHEEEVMKEPKNPPIPYNFEYNTRDQNGTSLFRKESGDGSGKVEGRYGYKDEFGMERIVEYVADENGYRAKIKTNEPGIDKKNSAASAEFYAHTNAQETKKYPETVVTYNAKPELKSQVSEEEKKNIVSEKVDSQGNNQYWNIDPNLFTYTAPAKSQHYMFPQKQDQTLRANENVSMKSSGLEQPEVKSSSRKDEHETVSEVFQYAPFAPAMNTGRQQFEILHAQVPTVQYTSPKHQPQGGNIQTQVITTPFKHYSSLYVPQNEQPLAIQNSALPSESEAPILSTRNTEPQIQHFYSLRNQQQPLVAAPLSYAHTTVEHQEYSPLGKKISGLSQYFN